MRSLRRGLWTEMNTCENRPRKTLHMLIANIVPLGLILKKYVFGWEYVVHDLYAENVTTSATKLK